MRSSWVWREVTGWSDSSADIAVRTCVRDGGWIIISESIETYSRPRWRPARRGRGKAVLSARTFGVESVTTSAVALMAASIVGSGLGLIFWMVAARLYPPETVGRAAAMVSAAILVGTLAQLNLAAVYVRFLGLAGRRAVRFVATGYVLTITLAVVGALGFAVSGLGDAYIGASWPERLLFVALAVMTMVFGIQDSVLTALRRATTVMVSNILLAVSKLSLLVSFVLFALPVDIVLAWLVPMTVILAVVSFRIFFRYLPATAEQGDDGLWPGVRKLGSFVGAEYLKGLLGMLPPTLIPLVVVQVLGVGANAYFTVPWTINGAIMALFWSTSGAFVAEGVAKRGLSYPSLSLLLKINGVIVTIGFAAELVTANVVLDLMGARYADHGAELLRWLAVGLPFEAITGILITFVWLEGRLWFLVGLQVLDNIVFLGLGLGLLRSQGIAAIGIAFFVSQALLGLSSLGPVIRRVKAARRSGTHTSDGLTPPPGPAARPTQPVMAGVATGAGGPSVARTSTPESEARGPLAAPIQDSASILVDGTCPPFVPAGATGRGFPRGRHAALAPRKASGER